MFVIEPEAIDFCIQMIDPRFETFDALRVGQHVLGHQLELVTQAFDEDSELTASVFGELKDEIACRSGFEAFLDPCHPLAQRFEPLPRLRRIRLEQLP